MIISKAYDHYLSAVNSGWSHKAALEDACHCWNVTAHQLTEFMKNFE